MSRTKNGQHPTSVKYQPVTRVGGQFEQHPPDSLASAVQTEVDGIQMGVLTDGTPYLSLRGLARMCGVEASSILRLANNWGVEVSRPRGRTIYRLLSEQNHPADLLYIRIAGQFGDEHAFPDAVCMALLEYYAFEAGANCTQDARKNYRVLARKSFRDFIYQQCGYDPSNAVPALWQPYIDRVSLLHNSVPAGYFGVFHATQELFVTLGQNGIHSNNRFLPDISVGIAWSAHWKHINGDEKYGARIKYGHNYPVSYPQADSNPQEPWAYPESALGEFSRWFRESYIAEGKLENYLKGRNSKKPLPIEFVDKALLAFSARKARVAPSISRENGA